MLDEIRDWLSPVGQFLAGLAAVILAIKHKPKK